MRALAADAETVIGIGMFEESFRELADLVLPGTSYLERDGTTVNLEGRLQRQRRAVLAPVPDVLAWLSKLAERFDVDLSPHASVVFDEVSERCFGGVSYAAIGEHAPLPARAAGARRRSAERAAHRPRAGSGLAAGRLQAALLRRRRRAHARARSSSARTPSSSSHRRTRARAGSRNGATVTVSSNGTSLALRARIARDLAAGTVRIPRDHAGDLHPYRARCNARDASRAGG